MSRRYGLVSAVIAGTVILGLLGYAIVMTTTLPATQRAEPLATIATGFALGCVALLAYLLERRSYQLEQRAFQVSHEPSLGIHWKNRATYRTSEAADEEASHPFYEEFVVWNAGDVCILLCRPSLVPAPELGPRRFGGSWVEVERIQGTTRAAEKAFPIVLGKGETCIWRQFTVHDTAQVSNASAIVAHTREEAVKFLLSQKGDMRFLYEIVYFSKPPADISPSDVYEQYVGFSYRLSLGKAND